MYTSYTCTYINIHIFKNGMSESSFLVGLCTRINIHICTYMYINIYTTKLGAQTGRARPALHVYVRTYIYVHMYIHVHKHINFMQKWDERDQQMMYTYVHIYMYICIFMYTNI